METQTQDFERIQVKVKDMGANARRLLEQFIPSEKWDALMRSFKNNPEVKIEVGLYKGELFHYLGEV